MAVDHPEPGLSVTLRQAAPIPLDLTLIVAPGELLALVGPSGSGKTTVLRAIAGLYRPDEGRIVCHGSTWLDRERSLAVPARQRRVGMVFQSYALFPHLSALENVMEAALDLPRVERIARARTLLAQVRLEGLEDRRPAALSGGQQQRVAVARALARQPDVLLLDEPFAAVDRMTRHRLQRELADLRRDLPMPVILVTHDLDEAARLADRIAVMHRGRILQTADPVTIMTRPRRPDVARLVGIGNIFEGELLDTADDHGHRLLSWRGYRLQTSVKAKDRPAGPVSWCIPADSVLLHRRERPSRGDHENPINGVVEDCVRLGEITEIRISPRSEARQDQSADPPTMIQCTVPSHVASRNGIEVGVGVSVSLKADAMQIMDRASSSTG